MGSQLNTQLSSHFEILYRALQYHGGAHCKISKWFDDLIGCCGPMRFVFVMSFDGILQISTTPRYCPGLWHWTDPLLPSFQLCRHTFLRHTTSPEEKVGKHKTFCQHLKLVSEMKSSQQNPNVIQAIKFGYWLNRSGKSTTTLIINHLIWRCSLIGLRSNIPKPLFLIKKWQNCSVLKHYEVSCINTRGT